MPLRRAFTVQAAAPYRRLPSRARRGAQVYIRSLQTADALSFRGFMFAESMERDWYSLLDGYVCQPDVPQEAWPGIALRSAAGSCAPVACGSAAFT